MMSFIGYFLIFFEFQKLLFLCKAIVFVLRSSFMSIANIFKFLEHLMHLSLYASLFVLNVSILFAAESEERLWELQFAPSMFGLVQTARQYIPPHIQKTETIPEFRSALNSELANQFGCIQNKLRLTDEQWQQEFSEVVKTRIEDIYDTLTKKQYKAKQESLFGIHFLNACHAWLTLWGIDPAVVRIEYNTDLHKQYPTASAIAGYCNGCPYMTFDPSSYIFSVPALCTWMIGHEAVHLVEGHEIQEETLRQLLGSRLDDPQGVYDELVQLRIVHERRAYLLPCIPLNDKNVLNEIIKNFATQAVDEETQGISWGNSVSGTFHPSFRNLLPYLIKLKDLSSASY
jgi:hypothetical protein